MTTVPKGVLLVEDEPLHSKPVQRLLESQGWTVHSYELPREAKEAEHRWLDAVQIAVIDHRFTGDETGLSFGSWVKERSHQRISTVLWTAHGDEPLAFDARKSGFDDYWKKGFDHADILKQCELLWQLSELRRSEAEAIRKAEELQRAIDARPISAVGGAAAVVLTATMRRTVIDIERSVGPSLMPVLIIGQTGAGKESIAREIHDRSGLSSSHWRAVNCAAFTDTLLMSELFGHVKGSFTGADSHRLGVILEAAGVRSTERESDMHAVVKDVLGELWQLTGRERHQLVKEFWKGESKDPETFYARVVQAARTIEEVERMSSAATYLQWLEMCGTQTKSSATGQIEFPGLGVDTLGFSGTLFLDEVADLSGEAQAALLRFLDGNGIRPVGYSGPPLTPKVRIIAATNRKDALFGSAGEKAAFRTDLLWRLAGWIIQVPALDEREDDAIGAAVERARTHGDRTSGTVPGRAFTISPPAQERLRELVRHGKFSGTEPIESGNFRNLHWLVDRACWIARSEGTGSVISLQNLEQAAAAVMNLQLSGIHKSGLPQASTGGGQATSNLDASVSDIVARISGARGALPAGYRADDLALDVDCVSGLILSLEHTKASKLGDIKIWFNRPHSLGEGASALSADVVPRWQYVFLMAALQVCGRHDNGEYEWKSATDRLGASPAPFRQAIAKLFARYGIDVAFPKTRQSRPLRDVVHFLRGDNTQTASTFTLRDPQLAESFRVHLAKIMSAVKVPVPAR